MDNRLEKTWWVLRITYGVVPIVAGLDKFTNLLTDWAAYLNPRVASIVPAATFMHVVGIVEIIVGIAVLSKFTRIAAWVAAAWLVAIALNLLSTGHYFDIAVRDLSMAIGAFALTQLSAVREQSHAHVGAEPHAPLRTKAA